MESKIVILDSVLIELETISGKKRLLAIVENNRHPIAKKKVHLDENGLTLEWETKSGLIEQVTIDGSSLTIDEILNEINSIGILIGEYKISDNVFNADSVMNENFEAVNYWLFMP